MGNEDSVGPYGSQSRTRTRARTRARTHAHTHTLCQTKPNQTKFFKSLLFLCRAFLHRQPVTTILLHINMSAFKHCLELARSRLSFHVFRLKYSCTCCTVVHNALSISVYIIFNVIFKIPFTKLRLPLLTSLYFPIIVGFNSLFIISTAVSFPSECPLR